MRLSISYAKILKVALPLMLGTFIQSLVMITDSAFLSRYSAISFDASGNAGLVYVTLFVGLTGLADASQIVMARRIGQNKLKEISSVLQSSLLIIFFFGILFFSIIQLFFDDFIFHYSKNQELAQEQIDFLSVRSYGFFMGVIMVGLNAFFMAKGKTWIIMVSTLFFAVSNVILDYLLIFGFGDVPAMGVKGAALASVISEGMTAIALILFLIYEKDKLIVGKFSSLKIKLESVKNILKVGSPLMIQGFISLSSWTIFFMFIEQMSTYDLTVSQTIRSIYFLAFVPIFGIGATTKTYVAQYMDHSDPKIIFRITRRMQLLTIAFLLLIFHGALFYPEKLVAIINPDELYIQDSAFILRLMFGSILLFGLTMPFFQTINGSGNTKVTMIIEAIGVAAYITYSYFATKVWGWEIAGVWSVEYFYFLILGVSSLIYLSFFDWRKKKY